MSRGVESFKDKADWYDNISKLLDDSEKYLIELEKAAEKLRTACNGAINESTIASKIETLIQNMLWRYYQFTYEPLKEEVIPCENGVIKRMDSRFRNIITEYKKDIKKEYNKNIEQLKGYIENYYKNGKSTYENYIGILLDGKYIAYLYFNEGIYTKTTPVLFDGSQLNELLKLYILKSEYDISSSRLLDEFAVDGSKTVTSSLAKTLYKCLQKEGVEYNREWEKIFKLAGSNPNNTTSIESRKSVLSQIFDESPSNINETKAIFALQTAYVILVKLIAYQILSEIVFQNKGFNLGNLGIQKDDELNFSMKKICSGEIFTRVKIRNLVESDFFEWFLDKGIWGTELAENLRIMINILNKFSMNPSVFSRSKAYDLFNDLYLAIMPKEVRHSLGEYYTPAWLADHVIKNTNVIKSNRSWRGLDSSCGSGTFVIRMIDLIKKQKNGGDLKSILQNVAAIDINPMAVLMCRINYFIQISPYIMPEIAEWKKSGLEIPVYQGDSALIPQVIIEDDMEIVEYKVYEKVGDEDLTVKLPLEMLQQITDIFMFCQEIMAGETCKLKEKYGEKYAGYIDTFYQTVTECLDAGTTSAWLKTIVSSMKTRCIGKFDVIVSNPPWIDWKSLPDKYREILKKMCQRRHVFSGDGLTGGVNLNICALLTSSVADTWLNKGGELGFLMPKPIIFQQTYKGFRNLESLEENHFVFRKFVDWSDAGHPFYPVTQQFMTYYLYNDPSGSLNSDTVDVVKMKKKTKGDWSSFKDKEFESIEMEFESESMSAVRADGEVNHYTFSENAERAKQLQKVSGPNFYRGRVGLGLYPHNVMLFLLDEDTTMWKDDDKYVSVRCTEKKEINRGTPAFPLEKEFLHPVIESPNIHAFSVQGVKFYAAFPYDIGDLKKPISRNELKNRAQCLHDYYIANEARLQKTERNKQIQGNKGEFYSLTRVGIYSFAPYRVVFRNNTKWRAAVIGDGMTAWNERKSYLLLDHACSVSQKRVVKGNKPEFISEEEAHYICAIMNSPIVREYMEKSSDSRSFKSDFPVRIAEFNSENKLHIELARISKEAHKGLLQKKEWEKQLDIFMKEYFKEL